MKKVTLEQIGKSLGVSKVAVYKALNGKEGVSLELKEKIINLAQEMGYYKENNSNINDLNFIYAIKKKFFLTASEQFYSPIYYYLNHECDKTKSHIQIVFLDDNTDNFSIINNYIKDSNTKTDGIFFAGEVDKDLLINLSNLTIPFLFIDFYSVLFNYNYIYIDNYHLSYSLTQYLITNGHKNIGFVGNINMTSSIADRYLGYLKALIENNIIPNSDWHINQNIEHISDIIHLLPENLPTAYICHCDLAAYKLYTACSIKGLSVPNDISVVSFDNTALCDSISPTLTSAGISKETIAKKAYAAMTDIIVNHTKAVNIVLKPKLIERNSVKK